jgi:hypothetical protein
MAWLKKEANVEENTELESSFGTPISVTNAYEVEITGARIQKSTAQGSKAMMLVVDVKNSEDETNRTYFTILGKDGNTYFETTAGGKHIKKEHFGLSIANTLFKLALNKEIFDCEPESIEYELWDKEEKKMVKSQADGFPELIGKKVGVCIQMTKEIAGKNSKEYGTIEHFFDLKTGLFAGEDSDTPKRKLDKWLASMKEYKFVEKEEKKSSFAKPESEDDKPKSKWGR